MGRTVIAVDIHQVAVMVDAQVGCPVQFIPVRGAKSQGLAFMFDPRNEFLRVENVENTESAGIRPRFNVIVKSLQAANRPGPARNSVSARGAVNGQPL